MSVGVVVVGCVGVVVGCVGVVVGCVGVVVGCVGVVVGCVGVVVGCVGVVVGCVGVVVGCGAKHSNGDISSTGLHSSPLIKSLFRQVPVQVMTSCVH